MTQADNPGQTGTLMAVADQLSPIFEGSSQGIYIFLDETHKVCNQRFAEMLGYDSPADWDRPEPFAQQYVDPGSRQTLVSAYQHAMAHQVGAAIDITWIKRDGGTVPTSVIIVPIAHAGELMALHYVSPS